MHVLEYAGMHDFFVMPYPRTLEAGIRGFAVGTDKVCILPDQSPCDLCRQHLQRGLTLDQSLLGVSPLGR